MLSPDIVVLTAIAYVCLLFLLAYFSDGLARRGRGGFLRSPWVYTLSISVYCTSWTFYGAAGTAARDGLEFMAIYMGPTLVFAGWWFILRKLLRIGHSQRITSIADLLSSRFGKSSHVAVLVTLMAVIAITPYIALQLKAITNSLQAITVARGASGPLAGLEDAKLAFGVATGMALFTILFGTRNVDAREQHLGVVAAIAFEAVVKLLAFVAVGLFVLFGMSTGPAGIYAAAIEAGLEVHEQAPFGSRWVTVLFLSAVAVICLPRQFQITVVENADENHLRTASWAFPAYLLLLSLFTLPIAFHGLAIMPPGSNPDMFVLTLPMAAGQDGLALFAFIGGFSSATSMIIIASIALSIMVSNHIVLPLALRITDNLADSGAQGIARLLLLSRRFSIAGILLLGFLYFWLTGESGALATIGLISFAGVAQFLPALLAALYWRGATVKGALTGMILGIAVWCWTLFLPSFTSNAAVAALVAEGPWGIALLRPQALLGMAGLDPLVHSIFWSMVLNGGALIVVSLFTRQGALERMQAGIFVDIFHRSASDTGRSLRSSASAEDLFQLTERVLGWQSAQDLFQSEGISRGSSGRGQPVPPSFVARLERELASSIGAASVHILLSKVVEGDALSLEEVMLIADETLQVISHSNELERKSRELRLTAQELQEVNAKLHALHRQKDDFLSQVSHEVRTPMTSIRSISEILMKQPELAQTQRHRFVGLIHHESVRLTRLLDEILDLSALEHGERDWQNRPMEAEAILTRAFEICEALARKHDIRVSRQQEVAEVQVLGDPDRLSQVFINIISNAISHNRGEDPELRVFSGLRKGNYVVEISDNGKGIAPEYRHSIFDKFVRVSSQPDRDGSLSGLGLGLNISHTIISKMSGRIELVDGPLSGACFRITLPVYAPTPQVQPSASGVSS
ncbi:sodium:solute symporter family transporter [Paracoccus sp. (in: a-proteobacteria)]|uniref:sodium:solute symporter family transporter n=1 Tax=Paracoccus sp. TaxID=267 RepID=UPI0028AA18FE|nr:ATP-binding protein [Paracoccus sp. (in: a-proteobacteria)]